MRHLLIITTTAGALFLTGCDRTGNQSSASATASSDARSTATADTRSTASENQHVHADGSTHDDHDAHAEGEVIEGDDHGHDEVPLGTVMIGDLAVELAQGHGEVMAGAESHLVVKLPYSDQGETTIRAWLGTEDRTLSIVGKGEYAPSHDDYDIHAVAPDPLPDDLMWWIEIEKPDGTRTLGTAVPLR